MNMTKEELESEILRLEKIRHYLVEALPADLLESDLIALDFAIETRMNELQQFTLQPNQ